MPGLVCPAGLIPCRAPSSAPPDMQRQPGPLSTLSPKEYLGSERFPCVWYIVHSSTQRDPTPLCTAPAYAGLYATTGIEAFVRRVPRGSGVCLPRIRDATTWHLRTRPPGSCGSGSIYCYAGDIKSSQLFLRPCALVVDVVSTRRRSSVGKSPGHLGRRAFSHVQGELEHNLPADTRLPVTDEAFG